MVQLGVRISQFYEHESCGKCTPCRVGTKWLTQILQKIEEGRGTQGDLDLLLDVAERINGKCLCPLGDSDAIAVVSYVAKFRDEFQAHIDEGGCPFGGASSLDGILAPVTVHERHIHAHGIGPHRAAAGNARMSDIVTLTIDDREVQRAAGHGPGRDGRRRRGSRSRSSATSRASGRRSAPAACASSRWKGCRSCRPAARSPRRTGWSCGPRRRPPRRREGQNATLEFILVNHPLDCPVCDKGGECPLQDLTFRYGPGSTRMTFPKLTFEKPIPISPLIALDRERCILCYRCTRFSSDVAEDDQLVARNRGAFTEIATFADDPYAAPFSGNVVELCPVGALTSTQYRFKARPWEIQNVPDRVRPLPGGLQRDRHDARGQGAARPLAQPPRDRRGLAVRQGPLRPPAPDRRGPHPRAARARPRGARACIVGRRAGRSGAPAPVGRGPRRHGALRQRDDRAGVRPGPAAAGRRRRAHGRAARVDLGGARRLPRAARHDRQPRRSSSSSATRASSTARRWSTCGSSRRSATAPRSSRSGPAESCRPRPARRRPRSQSSSAPVTSWATGCAPPSARC